MLVNIKYCQHSPSCARTTPSSIALVRQFFLSSRFRADTLSIGDDVNTTCILFKYTPPITHHLLAHLHHHSSYNGVSKNKSAWGTNRAQSHRASIPDWVTNFSASSCGGDARVTSYSLDMQQAVVTKTWTACSNRQVEIKEHHFAHQTRRNLLVHILNATNLGSTAVTLQADQHAGPSCGEASPSRGDGCDVQLAPVACGGMDRVGHRCLTGSILESELPTLPRIQLATASTVSPASIVIPAGETKVVVFARAFSSTLDATEPLAAAVAALESAEAAGAEKLVTEHVEGWAALWDEGTIQVEGDADLAAAVQGSLYNILSSARADFPYGLSPGGLASDGYHGHVFWDQEGWMWPPLNLLHPELAGSLLAYRWSAAPHSPADRSDRASENAQSYQLPGLMYPWESTLTGVPADTWQAFGPRGSSCETYETVLERPPNLAVFTPKNCQCC